MREYVLRPAAGAPAGRIDYARDLNEQQREVVLAGEGPILVIAGAGSGKTRTLTYRVARLVESGVPPSALLLLTFTNKAAREMLHRVEHLVGGDVRRIIGGTFHHVGNLVLRRHAELLGLRRDYTIMDREDAKDLLEGILAGHRAFPEAAKRPRADVLIEMLGLARNTDTPLERVVEKRFPVFFRQVEALLQACRAYEDRKRALNLMDFDDLLVFWRDLLVRHPEIRDLQHRQWRHILVDEYQDTNRLQAEIVERIAGEGGNLMVVGDDSQSIYSFRGAHFGNIIDFPRRHPGARIFRLETNYRSVPEILALANSSIRHNRRQFEKTLRAVRPPGGLPQVVSAAEAGEQAEFVVQRMMDLRDEGYEFRDMAVLYRAHYHSMELQMELTRRGIPFQVRSGLRFFEQAHIKDVAAYLKVAVNGKDELAWRRILALVPRVGKATVEKIWNLIERDRLGEVRSALPAPARPGWEDLAVLLGRLRGLLRSPAQMIRTVLEGGYEDYVQAAYANYGARLDDIRRLADYALRFDDAESFLSELALASTISGQDSLEEQEPTDVLVLSTVHQAKGLEWRAVFLLWLVEGKFPDARAVREEGGEEEERRLFYVACTRAKDRLFLCRPILADERSLRGVIQRPSRFLAELDPGTYEEVHVTGALGGRE